MVRKILASFNFEATMNVDIDSDINSCHSQGGYFKNFVSDKTCSSYSVGTKQSYLRVNVCSQICSNLDICTPNEIAIVGVWFYY